jgi:hypothetical protein
VGVLSELLSEIKGDSNCEQVRQLCDQIVKEEQNSFKYSQTMPKGPNLFLVLEVPGRIKDEIGYLALERESEDMWINVLFTTTKKEFAMRDKKAPSLKRTRTWEIKDSRPEKILTDFAKRYKFLRGE